MRKTVLCISIVLSLNALILSSCVVTTKTVAPRLIVTTYQYRDIWVVDCLANADADSILAIVASKATLPVLKITYSTREVAKVKDRYTLGLPCNKLDVLTGTQNGPYEGKGVAFEMEKVNGVWVLKGTYQWSM